MSNSLDVFMCPSCGSTNVHQESIETNDSSVSRTDYKCLICGWSQSSYSIGQRRYNPRRRE